ncbi:MAG: aminoacyl-histidine dipeptidase [Clostridia bacterium]|jgi:dipeptidase D|nr:aminoacyl-histidine dipeptidase [Clostridia bacterium]
MERHVIFNYFEEISKIPRGSKNEKAIREYLVKFAEDRGLEVYTDETYNVLIKKPAAEEYEDSGTIILQGHIDMVCEKNKETKHDFEKDGIELIYDGEFLKANGTTLGADNGIAVAYALAILDNDKLKHPALEIFLTADEETGMSGAENFDYNQLEGKTLINMDSEEEGEILVSCAGGVRKDYTVKIGEIENKYKNSFKIEVGGLKGGHSGADIHLDRGNANKILLELLNVLDQNIEFSISDIQGGSKDNAIPREAEVVIATDENNIQEIIKNEIVYYKEEFEGIIVSVEKNDRSNKVLDQDSLKKVVSIGNGIFDGVYTMSESIKGLVESSNNLGIMRRDGDNIYFSNLTRSSSDEKMQEIKEMDMKIVEKYKVEIDFNSEYPAWEYKKDSKIREVFKNVYKDMYGKEPLVKAIHAGLECGIFAGKMKDVDMVSFGPDMFDVHTPDEKLDIKSAVRMYECLINVLENVK